MEINDAIRQKLMDIGEEYESVKPFIRDYLEKIEKIVADKAAKQTELLEMIKSNSISVSAISKELGCSRTTLYNHNQLLKRYIEFSADILNLSNPYSAYENLKVDINKLKTQINLMEERDISFEILKQELSELTRMIKEKNKEIERLQTRINTLLNEAHELSKTNSYTKTQFSVKELKKL